MTIEERVAKSVGMLELLERLTPRCTCITNEEFASILADIRYCLEKKQYQTDSAAFIEDAVIPKVKPGERFMFYGLKMVALDVDREGITAITTEPVRDKEFDEGGKSNWMHSTLRPWLNSEWLADEGIDNAELIEQRTSIVPDDTSDRIGEADDYVQLLTCEQYRKWRKYIPDMDVWWWTMTPFSVSPSYCNNVRLVNSSGALNYDNAHNSNGVVPRLKIRLCSEAIKPIG